MRDRLLILATCVFFCSASHTALAQEYGDSGETGTYGYTSIYYDPSTNTVTAYSETQLFGGSNYYYDSVVDLSVQGYNYFSHAVNFAPMPGAPAYATINFQGTPGETYTATGEHSLQIAQKYWGLINNDYYGQIEWAPFDILDLSNYPFTAFSPDTYTQNNNNIDLGSTYDTASVSIPQTCADTKLTTLVKEYVSVPNYPGFKTVYTPQCSEFTQILNDPYFTFSQLNYGAYTWAILRSYFISNMDTLHGMAALSITSAYRNPAKEAATPGGGYPGSRHMYGDAVDLATNQSNWPNYQTYVHQLKACVEPVKYQGAHTLTRTWTGERKQR